MKNEHPQPVGMCMLCLIDYQNTGSPCLWKWPVIKGYVDTGYTPDTLHYKM
jgi:hypothetical protein